MRARYSYEGQAALYPEAVPPGAELFYLSGTDDGPYLIKGLTD